MQLGEGVEVLTISQEGLWAFSKPAGVLSHPNKAGEEARSLIIAPYDFKTEAYQTDEGPFFLLHRLDGPTSGVILGTPNASLAEKVKELLRSQRVKKTYVAIVANLPQKKQELWRDKLTKHRDIEGRGVRGAIGGGAPAETQMHVLRTFQTPIPSALLELRPLTGRTHQLRIQCAQRKLPIVGDATYGNFALNRQLKAKRLLLHAARVEIPSMNFEIECEEDAIFRRWGK